MYDYHTLVADPPWMERGGGSSKRGADKHYPLLHTDQIISTMLTADVWRPADDSILWLWATNNHLPSAMQVMDALGFRYVTNAVWVKVRARDSVAARRAMKMAREGAPPPQVMEEMLAKGLGQYLRGSHELLLMGVRHRGSGVKVRTQVKTIPSVIVAPLGRHSAKPDAAFRMIRQRCIGPRVNLFSRTEREGFDSWGPVTPAWGAYSVDHSLRRVFATQDAALEWARSTPPTDGRWVLRRLDGEGTPHVVPLGDPDA